MPTFSRWADVALESAEDATAILHAGLAKAIEHRNRAVERGLLPPEVVAVIDEIIDDFRCAHDEVAEAQRDIERASVMELVSRAYETPQGPGPHLRKRALELGIEIQAVRLVVDNSPPRPRRPRAA